MSQRQRSSGAHRALVVCLLGGLAGCASIGGPRTPDSSPASLVATLDPPAAEQALAPVAFPEITRRSVPEPRDTELLARLRGNFALPRANNAVVDRELAWYASNEAYLQRVFERARPYLFLIAEALTERQMPSDLALLPFVESAFDPFAYSAGRASGLWQIIPSTGKQLGLRQNWWFDARRDLRESTRAALDYLQSLNEQFGGDWLLAVAGYNSGGGNVARAVRKAEAAHEPADFWHVSKYLPAETRAYVPRLLAIRDLVAAPEKYGIVLPKIENSPRLAVVATGGQIDMALAARLAKLDVGELYRLNAGVNRWATDPEGRHELVMPLEAEPTFTAALAELGDDERVQWNRHRISTGETLIGLAHEFQTTPALLKAVNRLDGNLIRAGEYLLIPHAESPLVDYTGSVDMRLASQRAKPRNGVRSIHVVSRGESLWSIAQRYDLPVRKLASWNSMGLGDVLSVGRKLVVWQDRPIVEAAAATAPAAAGDGVKEIQYVVRRGDSLASIARRFRLTVSKLLEWNKISLDKYLQPGQRLVLFVDIFDQSS